MSDRFYKSKLRLFAENLAITIDFNEKIDENLLVCPQCGNHIERIEVQNGIQRVEGYSKFPINPYPYAMMMRNYIDYLTVECHGEVVIVRAFPK